jgi:hypothetical protein
MWGGGTELELMLIWRPAEGAVWPPPVKSKACKSLMELEPSTLEEEERRNATDEGDDEDKADGIAAVAAAIAASLGAASVCVRKAEMASPSSPSSSPLPSTARRLSEAPRDCRPDFYHHCHRRHTRPRHYHHRRG